MQITSKCIANKKSVNSAIVPRSPNDKTFSTGYSSSCVSSSCSKFWTLCTSPTSECTFHELQYIYTTVTSSFFSFWNLLGDEDPWLPPMQDKGTFFLSSSFFSYANPSTANLRKSSIHYSFIEKAGRIWKIFRIAVKCANKHEDPWRSLPVTYYLNKLDVSRIDCGLSTKPNPIKLGTRIKSPSHMIYASNLEPPMSFLGTMDHEWAQNRRMSFLLLGYLAPLQDKTEWNFHNLQIFWYVLLAGMESDSAHCIEIQFWMRPEGKSSSDTNTEVTSKTETPDQLLLRFKLVNPEKGSTTFPVKNQQFKHLCGKSRVSALFIRLCII